MSIKYTILGYLTWRPMSGYDVKKLIADSEILPWSANNNQIYKALVDMHRDGWLEKTVENQEGSPDRHLYAVTAAGMAALRTWVVTPAEPPFSKKAFFLQLMWADCLDHPELHHLLDDYLNTVGEKLFFLRVQADEKPGHPQRTERERYMWEMIYKNWIAHFELELKWIRRLQQDLAVIGKRRVIE